jgi:hypothetical protein
LVRQFVKRNSEEGQRKREREKEERGMEEWGWEERGRGQSRKCVREEQGRE